MVQRPAISPGIPSQIVEVKPSLKDVIAFMENSSGQNQIMQAKSGSSSSDSLEGSGIMTSARAKKMVLLWEIDIPEVVHFLFLPLEA